MNNPPQQTADTQKRYSFPTICIPQGNETFLIKPGKPLQLSAEIGATASAKILGLSPRHVEYLFSIGSFKTAHKPSGKPRGKWLVSRAEVEQHKDPLKEIEEPAAVLPKVENSRCGDFFAFRVWKCPFCKQSDCSPSRRAAAIG